MVEGDNVVNIRSTTKHLLNHFSRIVDIVNGWIILQSGLKLPSPIALPVSILQVSVLFCPLPAVLIHGLFVSGTILGLNL